MANPKDPKSPAAKKHRRWTVHSHEAYKPDVGSAKIGRAHV